MLKDITERKRVEKRYTERFFQRIGETGCGLGFDCEYDGTPVLHNEGQEENYRFAVSHPEMFEDLGVQERTFSYVEPAHGTCACGSRVTLIDQYLGACECPGCGQWYNLFGQSLVPPECWEHDPAEEEYW